MVINLYNFHLYCIIVMSLCLACLQFEYIKTIHASAITSNISMANLIREFVTICLRKEQIWVLLA